MLMKRRRECCLCTMCPLKDVYGVATRSGRDRVKPPAILSYSRQARESSTELDIPDIRRSGKRTSRESRCGPVSEVSLEIWKTAIPKLVGLTAPEVVIADAKPPATKGQKQ